MMPQPIDTRPFAAALAENIEALVIDELKVPKEQLRLEKWG